MMSQVVKVRRETLAACMTCPLCNKLLEEATTISLCLHSFCRRCIYEKLSDEEVDSCPVCNIDLGCISVEKLRPDHNLQDIRAKIFPMKRRKIKATESPSVPLPVKRKERSLSSLVVSTPKVPMQTGLTGRRTKSVARKAAAIRGSSFAIEEPIKKEEDPMEDCPESSSSPETLNKIVQHKRQSSSPSENFHDQVLKRDMENDAEAWEGNVDLWKPLNCLVEAANRTKSSKLNSQDSSPAKSETLNAPDSEVHMPKTKVKEHQHKSKIQVDKNGPTLLPGQVKRRRLRAVRRKSAAGGLCSSAQAILDSTGAKQKRRNCPIWFSLVASEDQEGDVHLPQISASYLRIKDGNLPVSFIQKYLVKKLDLTSEAEVEIMCQGQPVLPTLQLQNLVDLWLRTASTSKRVTASIGASAKDFVMVLSYCRKAETP
ncbi:hypothetical protein F0562_019701 [Nyssa sinensis]|uniref:RING-type domain-containing protein n=1 Tax=Nyssa sinensis TaxID=561372 RepID=A0A5J5BQH4_9ASTE|nr:hypothetical protein F0562_019701 [Nyssa sinensis]